MRSFGTFRSVAQAVLRFRAKQIEGAGELSLHGRGLHIEGACNLIHFHVLLVAKDHDETLFLRQRRHDPLQIARQKRIMKTFKSGRFGRFLEAGLRTPFGFAGEINSAMTCDFAQPEYDMVGGFHSGPATMELKKDLLGQFLSGQTIAQKMPTDAVDHGFVRFDDVGKRRQRCGVSGGDICIEACQQIVYQPFTNSLRRK